MFGVKHGVLCKILSFPTKLEVITIQIGTTKPLFFCLVYLHSNSSISETELLFRQTSDLCYGNSLGNFG